jgi:outer membrane protein insertion porin family
MFKRNLYLLFFFLLISNTAFAQVIIGDSTVNMIDYASPRDYEIGGITVTGVKYLDERVLVTLTGISVGDKIRIPGDKISKAIENLWKQGLLSDIKIVATKFQGDKIFLELRLQERPRLSKFSFTGVTKSDADKLREKIKLVSGKIITENLIQTTENEVRKYYVDKGHLNAYVNIEVKDEPGIPNSQMLVINVDKKKKVKINSITFTGLTQFESYELKRKMKETKEKHWYRFFLNI